MSENVFFQAVDAHIKWKIRLQKHLDGTSKEQLNPDLICQDNQCTLGKWIYGDGQKFKDMKGFEELRLVHSDFHQCASEIIRKTDNGHKSYAEALFKSKYATLSKDITRMLVRMNAVFKKIRQ
jgi:hypothetical protein